MIRKKIGKFFLTPVFCVNANVAERIQAVGGNGIVLQNIDFFFRGILKLVRIDFCIGGVAFCVCRKIKDITQGMLIFFAKITVLK